MTRDLRDGIARRARLSVVTGEAAGPFVKGASFPAPFNAGPTRRFGGTRLSFPLRQAGAYALEQGEERLRRQWRRGAGFYDQAYPGLDKVIDRLPASVRVVAQRGHLRVVERGAA